MPQKAFVPLQRHFMTSEVSSEDTSSERFQENPCWQDVYDDDDCMGAAASASFVASKWIKSLPCAAGMVSYKIFQY
jgi:hypothetical protein